MSDKKQIEEIAKVICKSYAEKKDCETCPTPWCYAEEYATLLYCAGYRKQIEAEWIEDGYRDIPCVCSHCGEEANHTSTFKETFDYDWEENLQSTGYEEVREYIKTAYCPHCGAKTIRRHNNGC
jgi:predicted RNA-binding Zn-ribbon protein involved in translation (DUF1610 family)